MQLRAKPILTAILLMVACVASTVCHWVEPSHACCQGTTAEGLYHTAGHSSDTPACCRASEAATLQQAVVSGNSQDHERPYALTGTGHTLPTNPSILLAHIPSIEDFQINQQQRYLKLRRLLN